MVPEHRIPITQEVADNEELVCPWRVEACIMSPASADVTNSETAHQYERMQFCIREKCAMWGKVFERVDDKTTVVEDGCRRR